MPRARPSPRAVVSKLAKMEACVLLPLGEGGPKGRMRVHFLPSPGTSRHPLPKGEGHFRNRSPNRESHETASILPRILLYDVFLQRPWADFRPIDVTVGI